MFARESDAVYPRLGDTNLVSSGRTLNSLYALVCESVFGTGRLESGKVSLRVCNLSACQKVAWRNDFWFGLGARGNLGKNRSQQHKVIQFNRKKISERTTERRILITKTKIITLKVVTKAATTTTTVTATTAVAQGVRTR